MAVWLHVRVMQNNASSLGVHNVDLTYWQLPIAGCNPPLQPPPLAKSQWGCFCFETTHYSLELLI
jgi:hypothetical protein